jgi:hypothetical protein
LFDPDLYRKVGADAWGSDAIVAAAIQGERSDRIPVFCNLIDQGAGEVNLPLKEYYRNGERVAEAQNTLPPFFDYLAQVLRNEIRIRIFADMRRCRAGFLQRRKRVLYPGRNILEVTARQWR